MPNPDPNEPVVLTDAEHYKIRLDINRDKLENALGARAMDGKPLSVDATIAAMNAYANTISALSKITVFDRNWGARTPGR